MLKEKLEYMLLHTWIHGRCSTGQIRYRAWEYTIQMQQLCFKRAPIESAKSSLSQIHFATEIELQYRPFRCKNPPRPTDATNKTSKSPPTRRFQDLFFMHFYFFNVSIAFKSKINKLQRIRQFSLSLNHWMKFMSRTIWKINRYSNHLL